MTVGLGLPHRRTRIPHYIWTNHSCSLCKCRIRCPCPALCGCCGLCCGGAEDDGCGEWRTCQRLGNLVVLLERVFVEDDPEGYRKEGSELWLVVRGAGERGGGHDE